ncbi:DUF1878 family protein [Pseudalkalibacillus caeni]|uniref:DUF1878 family protein n=1 Tax=Exobacillus caeni TaxID=2574798 RepID=A0A5R9FBW9_9BACL|nr:DUF1878 family protein [Pseudalkalibacillus caeni]TLS38054.1 DUF1878 family protein [Pseudalkalibacillus caeni]
MDSITKRLERIEFHQRLLAKMHTMEKVPFYRLVIEKGLTEDEMNEVLDLCEEVNQRFKKQLEEGLVSHTTLLIHFVGMLNVKLAPKETVESLYEQGIFPELMKKLAAIIPADVSTSKFMN